MSYNRFVELLSSVALPLAVFVKTNCLANGTGIAFIDSTSIKVCKNKRIKRNRVFRDTAELGKTTMGYFFGFKLHLIVNDKGELINFIITKGNVDDREPLKNERFVNDLKGKLFADKGYISKVLGQLLFSNGLHLITNIKEQHEKLSADS